MGSARDPAGVGGGRCLAVVGFFGWRTMRERAVLAKLYPLEGTSTATREGNRVLAKEGLAVDSSVPIATSAGSAASSSSPAAPRFGWNQKRS